MTRSGLQELTVDELVQHFLSIALAQDKAILFDEIVKFNRLYGQMEAVEDELKARGAREALLPLLEHPTAQVRLKAAIATLAVAPKAAREILQEISDRAEYPQAADARGMMRALDEGRYIPS